MATPVLEHAAGVFRELAAESRGSAGVDKATAPAPLRDPSRFSEINRAVALATSSFASKGTP